MLYRRSFKKYVVSFEDLQIESVFLMMAYALATIHKLLSPIL